MISTLCGANSFLLDVELKKRIADFSSQYDELNIEKIDAEQASLARIVEALSSLPFLADKKLVIIYNLSIIKDIVDQLDKLIELSSNDLIEVIFYEPSIDKRTSFYKNLKTKTNLVEFGILDEHALTNWLTKSAEQQSGKISLGDANYLINRVGTDQLQLHNELQKLLSYNSQINRESIDLLTEQQAQSKIFDLIDAAFSEQPKRALDIYEEQRKLRIEPQQIIAMLAWQLNIFAIIKAAGIRSSDQIVQDFKLSPFVVRKSAASLRNVGNDRLKSMISELLEIDLASKTTALDLDEALKNYIISV